MSVGLLVGIDGANDNSYIAYPWYLLHISRRKVWQMDPPKSSWARRDLNFFSSRSAPGTLWRIHLADFPTTVLANSFNKKQSLVMQFPHIIQNLYLFQYFALDRIWVLCPRKYRIWYHLSGPISHGCFEGKWTGIIKNQVVLGKAKIGLN